jgi:hypothetical protein
VKIKNITFYRATSRHRELTDIQDMLRYDVAFQSKKDPSLIAFPVFGTKQGNLGGKITTGRWDSFGIKLERVDRNGQVIRGGNWREYQEHVSEDLLTPLTIHLADWITYRHPRVNGQIDYTLLQPVTLEQYKVAKDHHTL